jgi:nitrite reductase/ring-hydroxylating ferredoxin subunit
MSNQTLCNVSDLPAEGHTLRIMHGSTPLCVAKQDGNIAVLDDICTHDHKTSLAEGSLCAGCVRCPRHGWAFTRETAILFVSDEDARVVDGRGQDIYIEIEIKRSDFETLIVDRMAENNCPMPQSSQRPLV